MFPFHTNTPLVFPTFFFTNSNQSAPQYFQPMIFPFGIMEQPAPSENQNQNHTQQIQNSEQQQNHQNSENAQVSVLPENPQISEEQKVIITDNLSISKNKDKKKKTLKPKRPLTYLTERAYYMNKKLRGKMKSDKRELRRRIRPKALKKGVQPEKKKEMSKKKIIKLETKKVSSKGTSIKAKKPAENPKAKNPWVYVKAEATLPLLLNFKNQLGQFINKKKFSLLQRQFT